MAIISKLFSWVLCTTLANYWNWSRRGLQEPSIYSQVGQGLWVSWGPTTCDCHLKNGGSLVGLSPSPLGSELTLGSVTIELNYRTPSWRWWIEVGVGKIPHIWYQKCIECEVKERHSEFSPRHPPIKWLSSQSTFRPLRQA